MAKKGNIFCCISRRSKEPEVISTTVAGPMQVFTVQAEAPQPVPVHGAGSRRVRHDSMTSCRSGDTFRSLSSASLRSTMSKNTGNYDYYSIYSNTSGRDSTYSCQSS